MKKNIVVVCGIIKKGNKFLLTQRAEPRRYRGKWQFPGGGVEPQETILDGLRREMKEELGVEIKKPIFLGRVWEIFRDNSHLIFLCFCCQFKNNQQKIIINKEAIDYGWFSYQQIKTLDFLELTDKFAQVALLADCLS